MKNRWYFTILLLPLLLSSCSLPTQDRLPPDTVPVETALIETENKPNILTDYSAYITVLDPSAETQNWIFLSTGCTFTKPEEVDLNMLFYLGIGHNGSWPDISAESAQHLIDHEFMTEMDLQIMPVAMLEEILQNTFGTSLSGMTIPSEWEYIKNENAYCSNHNDAFIPEIPTIIGVTEYPDGTAEITYTVSYFYDSASGSFYENPVLVLKLKQTNDDTWHVLSNTFG